MGYSRATSKELTFEHLWKWAQLKGVNVVGTGGIAHPGWLAEMRTTFKTQLSSKGSKIGMSQSPIPFLL